MLLSSCVALQPATCVTELTYVPRRATITSAAHTTACMPAYSIYLPTIICNACRCLLAGGAHDLPVIFKLSRMWFSLGQDKEIVAEMAQAAREVPSYKFLPLAYQLASRLSRTGRNSFLDDSGFSVRSPFSCCSSLKWAFLAAATCACLACNPIAGRSQVVCFTLQGIPLCLHKHCLHCHASKLKKCRQ